ncbi:MAG TPA: four helix bundle protein [Draconibacterium sp.]|nr:four helix bundle protein [Draconibacterium sp.]
MKEFSEFHLFDFETLELYKKSLDYVDFVYDCKKHFPKEELFGLTSQFRNAANSFSLNI